jgi:mono/diheme cytochrome c family protein
MRVAIMDISHRGLRILLASAILLVATACAPDPKSGSGFRLPDGNADAGKKAFVDLGCHVCHQLDGIDAKFEGTPAVRVRLGGETTRVRTYGDLVTSIINPSHRLATGYKPEVVAPEGKSLMETAALNDRMTVRQLTDLVAFLQGKYQVVVPEVNPYAYAYP